MTHHSVMTSSLRINILKIDKFGDFSWDLDYNSWTDVFRDVISLIINPSDPRRPMGASGGHCVRQPRSSSKRSALVYVLVSAGVLNRNMCSYLAREFFALVTLDNFRNSECKIDNLQAIQNSWMV